MRQSVVVVEDRLTTHSTWGDVHRSVPASRYGELNRGGPDRPGVVRSDAGGPGRAGGCRRIREVTDPRIAVKISSQPLRVIRRRLDRDDAVGREDGRWIDRAVSEPGQRRLTGCDPLVTVKYAGSGSSRIPRGALLWMAASRAPTSAAWRSRAASLTWRWVMAGMTVGRATALTSRMIRITTRSSIRVKPRVGRIAQSTARSCDDVMLSPLPRWSGGRGC